MKLYPSLISSNLLEIGKTIDRFDGLVDGYHLDIMDDHFVPNLTWGPAFINSIAAATTKPLHVHLMVDNPLSWVDRLNLTDKDTFIVHQEAVESEVVFCSLIVKLREKGVKVGLALNPETSIELLEPRIRDLDDVLIMSVKPGFSGQFFIPQVLAKVERLVEIRRQNSHSFLISMDGGINHQNIVNVKKAGVDAVGIAAAIFFQDDQLKALHELRALIQ